jgi:hypothetical protein
MILAVSGVAAFLASTIVSAQQPAPPARQPAPAQAVADSPEWQATRQAFQEWLTVQQIYTDEEIQKLVNDLRLRVAGMNEQERAAFLKDMQARLAVLNSDQARQARAWLGETTSRLTPAGQQKLRRQLPDVSKMSASELQQSLASQQLRMQARQRDREATARLRTQQNQLAMQMNQQRQQAFQDARQRQQSAVSSQATNRVQQGFQQSQQMARDRSFYAPGAFDPLYNPYIWTNPWVW